MMNNENETTILLPKKSSISSHPSRLSISMTELEENSESRSKRLYNSTFVKNLQQVTPLTVSWHNLTVKHKKTDAIILDNISGAVKSGQFVALMGSSGAGKTTLLNTLVARNLKNLHVNGQVLVDGRELGKEITLVSGYIQQNELFIPTLTIREHLMIQARLRLINFTEEQLKKRVSDIIKELGLRKSEHFRIGNINKKGISGGEMRRLCFANELLNNPALLFCDEPTTGLDSSNAESVINVMAKLCKSGRTIICTIHQPSSSIYRKFDKVMFLAKGRLAYFGEPAEAAVFLSRYGYPSPSNYNPADMIIDKLSVVPYDEVACNQRIQSICNDFDNSAEGDEFYREVAKCRLIVGNPPEKKKTASFYVQVNTLFRRCFLDNWRNPAFARAKIIQKIIMGLFIGLLYLQTSLTSLGIQNLTSALFYIVAELTYSTMFGVLTFLPQDYPLLVREYHDGLYSIFCYYIAKCFSYIPLFAIDGWIMVTIAYWMVGFVPTFSNYMLFLGTCFLIEQAASAFGIMLSATCPSYAIAVSIAGPVVTVLSLTGGFFANIGELVFYINWVQYISWFRYGFEALAILQWVGVAKQSEDNCVGNVCKSPESILKTFSFDVNNFYFNIIGMIVIIVVFYTIGFCGLFLRVYKSR